MKDQKVILEYLAQAIAHTQDSNKAKPHIRRAQRFVNGYDCRIHPDSMRALGFAGVQASLDLGVDELDLAIKSLRRAAREDLSNGAEAGVFMALDMLEAQQ